MKDTTFDQCISRMLSGDKEGLREIYSEYVTFIYSIILSLLKNKESAEDVTSEFFIRLWNTAGSYKPGNKHKAWLAAIAHNMAIDYVRKNRREIATDCVPEEAAKPEELPEQSVIDKMSFREALSELEEKEEQIINMKILGQLTFKEISKILQMPMGTVTWKYRNGIEKLRRSRYGA